MTFPYMDLAWGYFAKNLEDSLRTLRDGQYLVVSLAQGNQYVQFAALKNDSFRMEATSNQYVTNPLALLDQSDFHLMKQLGWNPSTHTPEQRQKGEYEHSGSPNFFVDVSGPDGIGAATLRATATIRYVFRAPWPDLLTYTAFARGGSQIDLPQLNLRRRS